MNARTGSALLPAIVALTSITACAMSSGARPIGMTDGNIEYRVSCKDEGLCDAAIARTCPASHTITAYSDEVIVTIPPTVRPFDFNFVCTAH